MEDGKKRSILGFSYFSAAAPREEGGRRLVDIRVIDTTENANGWRVTDEALNRALHTLIGAPLLAYPDHAGSVAVGHFINAVKPDGYIVGTAEVTDGGAWEKIKAGEWKWVSPQVYGLTREENDIDVLEDFTFTHIAFVPNPAYSSTQVLSSSHLPSFSAALMGALNVGKKSKGQTYAAYNLAPENRAWDFNAADYTVEQLRRACAWFDESKPDVKASYKLPHHLPDGTLVWRGVAAAMAALLGGRGGVDIPESQRRGVYEHLARHYGEFNREPPEYHASQLSAQQVTAAQPASEAGNQERKEERERMSQEIATLQAKVAELTEQNKTLKASLDALKAERHAEKVKNLLELRARAGLFDASRREEEAKRLGGLSDEVLDQLTLDAEAFIRVMPKPTGPKAVYTPEQGNVIEEIRQQLLGYRRDRDGKTVGGV
jgi:hypothetical protein